MAKSVRMITGHTNSVGNTIPEHTIEIKMNVKVKITKWIVISTCIDAMFNSEKIDWICFIIIR